MLGSVTFLPLTYVSAPSQGSSVTTAMGREEGNGKGLSLWGSAPLLLLAAQPDHTDGPCPGLGGARMGAFPDLAQEESGPGVSRWGGCAAPSRTQVDTGKNNGEGAMGGWGPQKEHSGGDSCPRVEVAKVDTGFESEICRPGWTLAGDTWDRGHGTVTAWQCHRLTSARQCHLLEEGGAGEEMDRWLLHSQQESTVPE